MDLNKKDLLDLAKQYFILDDGLSEINLVRRIQAAAGSLDCYATERAIACTQLDCRWRASCLQRRSAAVEQ